MVRKEKKIEKMLWKSNKSRLCYLKTDFRLISKSSLKWPVKDLEQNEGVS